MTRHRSMINSDASDKLQEWLAGDYSPRNLANLKESINTGDTVYIETLFRAMFDAWPRLKKNAGELAGAVRRLSWSVAPWSERGAQPTPEDQEMADLVDRALWRTGTCCQDEWAQSTSDLISSITYAPLRGLTVHEIIWEAAGGEILPRHYKPLLPSYYGWETLVGEPDKLLLYPNGLYSDRRGEKFPSCKFLISMDKSTIDHPIFNATLRSLVIWFGAAVWGPRWLMQYAETFGVPLRHGKYTDPGDKTELEKVLKNSAKSSWLVTKDKATIEVLDRARSGETMPQYTLIQEADKQCDLLLLGQTLTSDTGKGGGGSYALGEVHEGVRKERIIGVADFVRDVLQTQLVPAILKLNYGYVPDRLPQIVCSIPGDKATKDRVDLMDGLINRLGVSLSKQYVYDELGLPVPGADDEIFAPAITGTQRANAYPDDIAAAVAERGGKP